jgi:hypothetical protein
VPANHKRKLTIAIVMVALVAVAGGAYAATQGSDISPRQAFLNDVAKRLHVKPSQLRTALRGAFFDELNQAVKAGALTQAQANAIRRNELRHDVAPLAGVGPGLFPGPGRFYEPDRGFPGPERFFHGGFGFGVFGMLFGDREGVAKYLGITDKQLLSALQSGKTLAQVAKEHGKTQDGLVTAMLAPLRQRLDLAVKSGRIPRTQAQMILSRSRAFAAARIQSPLPRFLTPPLPPRSGAPGWTPRPETPGWPPRPEAPGWPPPGASVQPVPAAPPVAY